MTLVVSIGATAVALTLCVSTLPAQSQGAFITRLGTDTLAIERFNRSATRLEGEVLHFSPRVRVSRYRVDIGPDGEVKEMSLEQRSPNDTLPPGVTRMTFDADSIRSTSVRGERRTYRAAPGRAGARPEALYLWGLYELETAAFAKAPADSMAFWFISLGGTATYQTVFRRRAPDTLSTMWFYPEYHLDYAFSRDGRLMGLNGLNTTVKVMVERVPAVPLETLIARAAEGEKAKGAFGAMSPLDSVAADVGSARVKVVYSRPAKRGRPIWGGLVPFDQIWRTGADAATKFSVSSPIMLGETRVPAGEYTLYSVSTKSGASLIVNKQTGQWGTEYHAEQDLARIPVQVQTLDTPTERFTISVEEGAAGIARLVLEWDRTRWIVPLRSAGQG